MHRFKLLVLLIIFGLISCTTLSVKARMEKFGRIAEAYEFSLLNSDYLMAARFIEPSAQQEPFNESYYKNIKIVEYKITHMEVSDDRYRVTQDVELQYFLLNNNRLRTIRYHQLWRYNEAQAVWLLYSSLPKFRQ